MTVTLERRAIPADEYLSFPALSNSGMRHLAVSPLRFWHMEINPERPPDEPTPEMQFGSALHCAVLEPDEYSKRYACKLAAEDIEDCLVTIDELRAFLRNCGSTPKGTRKAELIAQVQAISSSVPIFEVIEREHAEANPGKTFLKKDDWTRVEQAALALLAEPHVQSILKSGQAEVSMFAKDEKTGVALKGRMDLVTPTLIFEVKTFSQKRGKSIDKSIADAIFYEGYYRQAYLYSLIRGWPETWRGEFVMAFVESEQPHEVRLKALRPKTGGNVNLYWVRGRIEVRNLIQLYADCVQHFGDRPWRYAQEITPLADEEMPGLAY